MLNQCPVCGIQLSPSELDSHFLTELDRLYRLTLPAERQRLRNSLRGRGTHGDTGVQLSGSRWETLHRIRANRQRRSFRKRRGDCGSPEPGADQQPQCPVCHGTMPRTQQEIRHHFEECLRRRGASTSDCKEEVEEETVDVES